MIVVSTPERLATLETQMQTLMQRLDHLDLCVDKLQRTIWQASGAVAVLVALIQLMK